MSKKFILKFILQIVLVTLTFSESLFCEQTKTTKKQVTTTLTQPQNIKQTTEKNLNTPQNNPQITKIDNKATINNSEIITQTKITRNPPSPSGSSNYCTVNTSGEATFHNNIEMRKDLTCDQNINLPSTNNTATVGVINIGGIPFVHNYDPSGNNSGDNTFLGVNAGNFSMTGIQNTAIGSQSLFNNTTGGSNSALGFQTLEFNTTGTDNTALGWWALRNNTTAAQNTAVGSQALTANTTGTPNTAVGYQSLFTNSTGNNNVAIGDGALKVNTENKNTAVGSQSLFSNTTGNANIALGYLAGSALTTGSNNIDIGNIGVAGESNAIRIGATGVQGSAYIAGIHGIAPSDESTILPVFIDANGQLGTDFTPGSILCYLTNIALGDSNTLLTNYINPVASCTGNDSGTTEFSGNVKLDQNINLPATSSGTLGVVTVGTGLTPFIHNYGPAGDASDDNTFIGLSAGNFSMTGANNTAMGSGALASNTAGEQNTAMGASSLSNNTTGLGNTALGRSCLELNTTGTYNTAVGLNALRQNQSWGNNAFGASSLSSNTTGFANNAFGTGSLASNTSGDINCAFGDGCLTSNTSGDLNNAFGTSSLLANTSGRENIAFGTGSLTQNTTGARNISVGNNSLVSNMTGNNNIALGHNAGSSVTGDKNIAIGNAGVGSENSTIRIGTDSDQTRYFAAGIHGVAPADTASILPVVIDVNGQLGTDSTGSTVCFAGNVALGDAQTLLVNFINPVSGCTGNDSGTTEFSGNVKLDQNINLPATSSGTLGVVTVGTGLAPFIHNYGPTGDASDDNTFIGLSAGNFGMTGSNNTALGASSLAANTSGNYNTALGSQALKANTSGTPNTAIGYQSLFTNSTGNNNVAVGDGALQVNTENQNTAIGSQALIANTTGNANIALGYLAGSDLTTGSNNIDIGNVGVAAEANTIRIGVEGTQTSAYVAGIYGATTSGQSLPVLIDVNGQLGTISSSRRYKKDIKDMNEASAQLMQLHPVNFTYKNDASATLQYGLIAEEVAEVFPELVVFNKEGEPETIMYQMLPPMLLNEYQQQQKQLDAVESQFDLTLEKLDLHDSQLNELIKRIEKLEETKSR